MGTKAPWPSVPQGLPQHVWQLSNSGCGLGFIHVCVCVWPSACSASHSSSDGGVDGAAAEQLDEATICVYWDGNN